ncbi:hypothetical protein R3W88_021993 [Solanum pinnatisectum]|uniref:Serine protease n=1 Tax=Solanum pinnatisectum TaxID=50273 RepID=A0AAV9LWV2_9SOLN|nr:hypothetical protein R3W88_021993 [Solanum pinnatisectum]
MKILKFFLVFTILGCLSWPSIESELKMYIVHIESQESQISTQSLSGDLESWYQSFLPNTIASTSASSNEEASRLQVKEMEKKPGFIAAWPERILSLHTTHSSSFLGLQQNIGLWKNSNYGKGVIIGVLDTGISPDHPSFSDEGMPPPPAKWKGKCESNFTTKCNNKIIGARTFPQANGSPIDDNGHGTHTASTIAGSFVKGANVFGNAIGTAVGIAPLAHLAIYKVCDSFGCSDSGVLSAMDAAIDDGVDILSLSLGGTTNPFHSDPIALGAYSATQRGILVSCSAGNNGPFESTVVNEAPWILTVGASTLDRKIKATLRLGNKEEFEGESAFHPKVSNNKFFPLFDPSENATDPDSDSDIPFCGPGLTELSAVAKGKIVLCEVGGGFNRIEKGKAVKNAGGVGMILTNRPQDGSTKSADAHVLPALDNPVARITFQGTIIGDKNAPVVAAFSARGPSTASPGILKPDIIGPGVNILAAWHNSVENKTNTKSTFNIISGTSMSCPHLSGVAALLKSAHPTCHLNNESFLSETLTPARIFAYGAGQVNPSRASDPGLVYDTQFKDYLPYLCGLNYSNREGGNLLQRKANCSKVKSIPEAQLNCPSFSISLGEKPQTYTRTVTNVGEAKSTYRVEIVSPRMVSVVVKPSILKFSKLNQKMMYRVTFSTTTEIRNMEVVHGYMKWTSNKHFVRSPIAVVLQEPETPDSD